MRLHLTLPFPAAVARLLTNIGFRLQRLVPKKFTDQERIFFAQRLAFLVDGGVPLMQGLTMMREQMRDGRCSRTIDAISDDIANGRSLSQSLRKFPDAFGAMAVTLIEVGETCGMLSQNLQHLADELKKRRALRKKIVGALTYPALVMCATAGITVFLTVYLLPKLAPVFLGMHMALPASTRAVLAVSAFVRMRGPVILVALAVLAAALAFTMRRSVCVRIAVTRTLLRIPVVGALLRNSAVANFSRSVGLLLASGMALRDTLVTYAAMSGDAYYENLFIEMSGSVSAGERVSLCLRRHPDAFPDLFAQMIAVGEQSGKLPDTFLYLSDHYEREIDDIATQLSTLVEPALMLGTGAIVGFIAFSIISPMYAITQSLHA